MMGNPGVVEYRNRRLDLKIAAVLGLIKIVVGNNNVAVRHMSLYMTRYRLFTNFKIKAVNITYKNFLR